MVDVLTEIDCLHLRGWATTLGDGNCAFEDAITSSFEFFLAEATTNNNSNETLSSFLGNIFFYSKYTILLDLRDYLTFQLHRFPP